MKYSITDVTFFKFPVSYKTSHTFIPYGSMGGIKVKENVSQLCHVLSRRS